MIAWATQSVTTSASLTRRLALPGGSGRSWIDVQQSPVGLRLTYVIDIHSPTAPRAPRPGIGAPRVAVPLPRLLLDDGGERRAKDRCADSVDHGHIGLNSKPVSPARSTAATKGSVTSV